MKVFNPESVLYMVLCRDELGHIWYLKGDLRSGIKAGRVGDDDHKIKPHLYFAGMAIRAIDLFQFKALHRALGDKRIDAWWQTTAPVYGVKLLPDSVFYRSISMKTQTPTIVPHHKQKQKQTMKSRVITICGSTVHHKTNSITLVGQTDKALNMGIQVVKEVERAFNVIATYEFRREGRNSRGETRCIELKFYIADAPLSRIRKHLQEVFV